MSIDRDKDWSASVADSLRDAEMEVSDQVWSRIVSSSQPTIQPRRVVWLPLLCGVAAAVVFGVIAWMDALSPTLTEDEQYMADNVERNEVNDVVDDVFVAEREEIDEVIHTSSINSFALVDEDIVANDRFVALEMDSDEETRRESDIEPQKEADAAPKSDRVEWKVEKRPQSPKLGHPKRSSSIALNFTGMATNLSSSTLGNLSKPVLLEGDVITSNYSLEPRFLDAYENGDISHRQPFGAALSVGLPISDRFTLVSGVSYTSLVSDITTKYKEKTMLQRLHFVGIPLRVDYNFLNNGKFLLYGGAGGGVEYLASAKVDDLKIDENRWYYSATGVVGAEYRVARWLGLYAEPELSYYLNHTKLKTTRTDYPLSLTMRFGVRFAL